MRDLDSPRAYEVFVFGRFTLFPAERLLKKDGECLAIGGRALELLTVLLERAGEVVSHQELIGRVWPNLTVEHANLRVHIAALRRVLGVDAGSRRYISCVSGRGYCFVAPVRRCSAEECLPRIDVSRSLAPHFPLPARPVRMVGRDETIRTVLTLVLTRRFVSIIGPGGIGKTAVAVSVAYEAIDAFRGAIYFVDLSCLTDPQLAPTAVASALGCTLHSRDPIVSLLAFMRQRRLLLVLDNCEPMIKAAAQLAERVAEAAPQAYILVTSREALQAAGEHVHILSSLEIPPENANLTATEALRYPATQLFMERAASAGYQARLSELDVAVLSKICRKLDGIPLAIELAAGRAGSHGIRGMAKLLDNRFDLVWKGRRTALPRHQTLSATLDWSYNLLSEREKEVFCGLSVFVGDFKIAAASAVVPEGDHDEKGTGDVVAGLISKSLISVIAAGGTYRMLNITRAYAARKLNERGNADEIRRKHAVWVHRTLQQNVKTQLGLVGRDLSELRPHLGNVRAALDWALSALGDPALGVELTASAASLLISLSLLDECRRYSERALAILSDQHVASRTEMILQEMKAYSSMFTRGNSDDVRLALDRGLFLANRLDDGTGQLSFLAGLNSFLYRTGDFRGALEVARRARIVAQAFDDSAGIVMAEWMLGVAHHCVGNQADAERHCQEGMIHAVQRAVFNPTFFGYDHRIRALVGLAGALWLRGYANRALSTARQAVDEATAHGRPISVCMSLYTAQVFFRSGFVERARELADRLIAYAGKFALNPYQAVGTALKAELAIASGELETGIGALRHAMSTLHLERHNLLQTVFSGALAEGLRKARRFDEGMITIDGAIDQAISSGAAFELAELLRLKAELLVDQTTANCDAAVTLLNESLRVAREQSALAYELRSAITLARLLSENGRRDQARDILRPIYDRFTEGFETPDLQYARALLEDLS
jgi:predicted ATPase/DNA-binding winged helix-turn-helix (wHTH) protein